MESPGKYEENETNRDLLRSTIQKLPIFRRRKTPEVANLSFTLFLLQIFSQNG
jgi:hypothetical protein